MRNYLPVIILFIICATYSLQGQSCNGSLGIPVFTEDFGNLAAPGYGSAISTPGSTTYLFLPTGGLEATGTYTIATNTNLAKPEWHNSLDHTIDPANRYGNMFIVNAAQEAGEFYKRKVSGLCAGQTYQFSAYLMNALADLNICSFNEIPINVRFQITDINGNVLGFVDSGNIFASTNPVWQKVAFDFVMPSGVSELFVVLLNNGKGGCGNDLAIDDITFRACSGDLSVTASDPTLLSSGICGNTKDLLLTAHIQSGIYNKPEIVWEKSTDNGINWIEVSPPTNNLILNLASGSYHDGEKIRFRVAETGNANSINCFVFSPSYTFRVTDFLIPTFDPIPPFCEGDSPISLPTVSLNGISGSWSPPFNPKVTTNYLFTPHANECASSTTMSVTVYSTPDTGTISGDSNLCVGSTSLLSSSGDADGSWSSSNPDVATINNEGLVTSIKPGTTIIRYTINRNNCPSVNTEFSINVSSIPSIPNITIEQPKDCSSSDSGIIEFTNTPGLQYSIDGGKTFHNNPVFNNLKPGEYTLVVKNSNHCESSSAPVEIVFSSLEDLSLLKKIPSFFSPNGDGKNDFWLPPIEVIKCFPNAKISIFDRYGRVLYEMVLNEKERGWNGKTKDITFAIDDYWYILQLTNGKKINGHFSLIQ